MTAVAVHRIAVHLFNPETSRHKDDGMFWRVHKTMYPTLFRHPQYCDYNQYPDGLADGVGYWAKNLIFGGVVLFDRRDPDSPRNLSNDVEVDVSFSQTSISQKNAAKTDKPNSIYFHSDGRDVTYRIYQLTDSQRQHLLKFLVSETTPPAECPIPIYGTEDNRQRVDPEEAVTDTGIYRDLWERKPLASD
jgi:hypothetical protein